MVIVPLRQLLEGHLDRGLFLIACTVGGWGRELGDVVARKHPTASPLIQLSSASDLHMALGHSVGEEERPPSQLDSRPVLDPSTYHACCEEAQ